MKPGFSHWLLSFTALGFGLGGIDSEASAKAERGATSNNLTKFDATCPKASLNKRFKVKYITNMETGEVITGENLSEKSFFQASVTKQMLMYVAGKTYSDEDLDKIISVPKVDFKDAQNIIDNHDVIPRNVIKMTRRHLLYAVRINSSNRAAYALALDIGSSEAGYAIIANRYAKGLGMRSHYSSASGFPTKLVAQRQSTDAESETLLVAAKQRDMPELTRELNVTSKRLEGYTVNSNKPVNFTITTGIQAQKKTYDYYIDNIVDFKSGRACTTGLAASGVVNISNINFSFVMAGYTTLQARDKDLKDEISKIEKRIENGEIKKIKPVIEQPPIQTFETVKTETAPQEPSVSNAPTPADSSMPSYMTLGLIGIFGFAGGLGVHSLTRGKMKSGFVQASIVANNFKEPVNYLPIGGSPLLERNPY